MFPIFVVAGWREGLRHNFWEIWRGVRANLPFLRGGGGYCVIFLLEKLIFRPTPPPPDNYCTVPKTENVD